MRRPSHTPAVTLVVLALGLWGCGDDGGGNAGGTADTTVVQEAEQEAEAQRQARKQALARKARRLIRIARQSQEGKSMAEQLRIADAQAQLLEIAKEDLDAVAPLVEALERPDYDLAVDIYSFFIQLGKPGTERILAEALYRLGATDRATPLVFAYLDSHNRRLEAAAREWASGNGFTISGSPAGLGVRWGSSGVYKRGSRP
jgi:hypothetical protein